MLPIKAGYIILLFIWHRHSQLFVCKDRIIFVLTTLLLVLQTMSLSLGRLNCQNRPGPLSKAYDTLLFLVSLLLKSCMQLTIKEGGVKIPAVTEMITQP